MPNGWPVLSSSRPGCFTDDYDLGAAWPLARDLTHAPAPLFQEWSRFGRQSEIAAECHPGRSYLDRTLFTVEELCRFHDRPVKDWMRPAPFAPHVGGAGGSGAGACGGPGLGAIGSSIG